MKLHLTMKNNVNVDGFRMLAGFLLCAAVVLLDMPAMAQGDFAGGMCAAVKIMTGPAGKAVATAGVIVIAVGALLGRVSWGMAVMIAAGIAGIFGAPKIAELIASASGGTSGSFCG